MFPPHPQVSSVARARSGWLRGCWWFSIWWPRAGPSFLESAQPNVLWTRSAPPSPPDREYTPSVRAACCRLRRMENPTPRSRPVTPAAPSVNWSAAWLLWRPRFMCPRPRSPNSRPRRRDPLNSPARSSSAPFKPGPRPFQHTSPNVTQFFYARSVSKRSTRMPVPALAGTWSRPLPNDLDVTFIARSWPREICRFSS